MSLQTVTQQLTVVVAAVVVLMYVKKNSGCKKSQKVLSYGVL